MSRIKYRAATLFSAVTALLFSVAVAPPSAAATVLTTFEFTTVVDASVVGGSVETPLRVIYRFDPALTAGTGPFGVGENFASYGPIESFILQLGAECAVTGGSGSGVTVFNDAGPAEDSYDVRIDGEAVTGKTLFGQSPDFFRFLLVDPEGTMFSNTSIDCVNVIGAH